MNTFFHSQVVPGELDLGEDAAHHARVKRLTAGEPVSVTNGKGSVFDGSIISVAKNALTVTLGQPRAIQQPFPIHLYVPVADRDRMLWLAEKAAELQVATWTPVMFHRSKSVSPRGEGEAFDRKLKARMISAIEQSGGAWLPEVRPTIEPSQLRLPTEACGYLLERGGSSLVDQLKRDAYMYIVVGPEGGFETTELEMLRTAGWKDVSVGHSTLRFETAAIAAVSIGRAASMNL